MARKHGFKGTPLRPPKGVGTMGRVFDQRGDPMVSAREGREKYGRNLSTENPDFDRYFAEDAAKEREREAAFKSLKPSQVDKGNAFRSSVAKGANTDPQRAAANVVLKMDAEMRLAIKGHSSKPKVLNPHRVKGSFYYFPDQTEKLKNCPTDKPRPFFHPTKTEKKK